MEGPTLTCIVVNHEQPELTRRCLAALQEALARTGPSRTIVVDNGSRDDSAAVIQRAAPWATLLELPRNVGFAPAVNEAMQRATTEWILLLNNDVLVEPNAVAELLRTGETAPEVGSVAAQMRFAGRPDVINSAGISIDRLGIAYDRLLGQPATASESRPVEVFGASGGAALHRREMLRDVGGLDDSFFFALDDADLAWRARMRGWRCLYAPDAVVYHHHGATGMHGSELKYFHSGLNRVRTLAKNAHDHQLRRYGAQILAYDVAYVGFAALNDRTLAPLRGRLRGLRQWREYRRAGRSRRPVELEPPQGLRAAMRRRQIWRALSAGAISTDP